MYPSIAGVFANAQDSFDPKRHAVRINLNAGNRLQESLSKIELRRVEVDGTGRLLIPKDLVNMAGIAKEVTIAPIGKRLEIWDKAKYDKKIMAPKDEKKKLAKQVMSGAKPKDNVS